jgi:hypothetical protein
VVEISLVLPEVPVLTEFYEGIPSRFFGVVEISLVLPEVPVITEFYEGIPSRFFSAVEISLFSLKSRVD